MILGNFKKIVFGLFVGVTCLIIYRYNPYRIEFIGYYDKAFAHRVNNIEKLNSSLKFFNGVELDLVFQKNTLDVNHPPAPSISLSFRDYFNNIPTSKTPFLWLDIKNLNKENSNEVLTLLQSIFEERGYPVNKVLIETSYPEALPIFTKIGYKTSYYLPYGLRKKTEVELEIEINKIDSILKKQPDLGISSDYRDYNIMNQNFPKKDKYLWMTTSITERWFQETRSILKDEKVKVVLVSYNAIYGNR